MMQPEATRRDFLMGGKTKEVLVVCCTRRLALDRYLRGLLAGLLATVPAAAAEQAWGTVKGRVVFAGTPPEPEKLNVSRDRRACLKDGPLLSEGFVVNPRNKGVRWVVLWLTDVSGPRKALPIHPALREVSTLRLVVDQPRCLFEPHVLGVRQGQTVVVKNSAAITHTVRVAGDAFNPELNVIQPAKGEVVLPKLRASAVPVSLSCSIHPWMRSYLLVFKHPYFAVTDEDGHFEISNAPAGKYRLVGWQESVGPVTGDGKPGKDGMVIEIRPDAVTDLGKIPLRKD